MSLRIVILADTLDTQYAGVYYYTRGLIQALVDRENGPELILVRSRAGSESWPIQEHVVPIKKIPGHASYRLLVTIPRLINSINPDWVIEPSHFGPFNLNKSIKRATIIHDITPILMPENHVWHSQVLQRLFLPGILKKDDRILVNSNYTKGDLIKWKPELEHKIHPIYAGCEELFRPSYDSSVQREFSLRERYFLYTGTIEPRKDVSTLLKAFTIFKEKTKADTQLVLSGKWGWKNVELLHELDHHRYRSDIVLTGYIDRHKIPVLMSGALAFIYPSLYEGFGLPVLEAMSCGAPVITTDVSSLPEVGEDAVLYFKPRDIDALSEYMIQLLTDEELTEAMRFSSIRQAKEYSWEKTAELFLQSLTEEGDRESDI